MKKILFLTLFLIAYTVNSQVTITPNPFEVNQSITITVDVNSTATDTNTMSNPTKVYIHSGVGPESNPWTYVVGNWGQDDGVGEMTDTGGGIWSITLTPEAYYGLTTAQATTITKMGMVFRNEDGTQELKDNGNSDFFFDVGAFQVSLTNPTENSTTILNSGANLNISATNIGGNADYVLKTNGSIINSQPNISSYSYTHTSITSNQNYELEVTLNATTITKYFNVLVDPGTTFDVMATDYPEGINYDIADPTKAILVLDATGKDFVYVAGSFNNWQPSNSYAMKRDPTRNSKFWIELTGLTSGEIETYQYWVVDKTPITNSPALVKTADPFSTLVLSPFDDPWIPPSTYPNLPTYPAGQEREVTVLQTGQTPYNWQVTNFNKPKKEDLIIYQVLIRDFDQDRNYQNLIDKIDYFKNLNVTAIQLLPNMEFEGNESWGYNPSFHMALDKFYGTENKFKEFVDLCHQNGIAVILDLVLNQAFGRNPMVRMWMDDPDGDGWGGPSSENPYFNQEATHAFSVGEDFNHQQSRTQNYVQRVIKHWVEEFKIDGFRWDLTKGFTQNCTPNDTGCTGSYQQDRVDILKQYADYSWSLDPDHYVIFEHLGDNTEETEWANYRFAEGKGIMLWGKTTDPYNQLTMGFASGSNINGMGHLSRGFAGKRLVGYSESHDEERLMYRNLQFGNNSNGSHNVRNLNTALSRMSALGAVSLTIPGPKMIWHFADLGMENSIFTCNDGSVNDPDCKLDTKPQPQWVNNWLGDNNRSQIYNDWSRLNHLKTTEAVFEGNYSINSGTLTPRIFIWDDGIPTSELKNIVILSNFNVTSQNVTPDFPYTGTWYDLMDESGSTSINVTNTTSAINIPAGGFKIYGNKPSTLSIDLKVFLQGASINPNGGEANLMRDDLRVSAIIPTTSPFADNLTVASSIFNNGGTSGTGLIQDNIVDWVWVELRDENNSSNILLSRSGLLQRDGNIVDVDGISPLHFNTNKGNYFVAVNHRNHLGVISATALTLNSSNTSIDFSSNSTSVEGGANALTDLGNGVFAILAGDFDENAQIQNTDASSVVTLIGGSSYSNADIDANTQIQNTDINILINPNIGKGEQYSRFSSIHSENKITSQTNNNIKFSFANSQITNDGSNDFYEVDVLIESDIDFKLGSGLLYFNYNNEAFGTHISDDGKVEITNPKTEGYICGQKDSAMGSIEIYGPFVQNDNTSSRFAFSFQQAFDADSIAGDNVTATPTKLFHLKIKYSDVTKNPNICFENSSLFINQFFTKSGAQLINDDFDCVGAKLASTGNIFENEFSIYPNPAQNAFYINNSTSDIKLYDITGKIIKEFNGKFNKNHEFNVSLLAEGFYLVTFKINGNYYTKRLILN